MTHSPTPAELLAIRTGNAALLNSPDSSVDIVATIVFALGSAGLLMDPETTEELRKLRALTPAPVQTCQVCGTGYDYGQPCSICEFKKRMAAALAEDVSPQVRPTLGDLAEQRHLIDPLDHTFEHLAPGGAS